MILVVRSDDKLALADAVTLCIEFARSTTAEYVFGPLVQKQLLAEGLTVSGDTEELRTRLEKIPGVSVEEAV